MTQSAVKVDQGPSIIFEKYRRERFANKAAQSSIETKSIPGFPLLVQPTELSPPCLCQLSLKGGGIGNGPFPRQKVYQIHAFSSQDLGKEGARYPSIDTQHNSSGLTKDFCLKCVFLHFFWSDFTCWDAKKCRQTLAISWCAFLDVFFEQKVHQLINSHLWAPRKPLSFPFDTWFFKIKVQSTNQPSNQPTTAHPTKQPILQPTNLATNQSYNQPTNLEPILNPTSQSFKAFEIVTNGSCKPLWTDRTLGP